jgi:hypothetical protein
MSVFVDHGAEASDGREPLAAALVEAADLHLLAGEVIADQIDLQPRVRGVAAGRIAADDVAQRIQRSLGDVWSRTSSICS